MSQPRLGWEAKGAGLTVMPYLHSLWLNSSAFAATMITVCDSDSAVR